MESPENSGEGANKKEWIVSKERIKLEEAVIEEFEVPRHYNGAISAWIKQYNDRMREIIDSNEDIQQLALSGDINQAAKLVKEKLDNPDL
ncbi:MAG: hypothetical protein A3J62_03615 [Candidatus Buchananbacteria bacterium RIFCSPHIGHO2_02_FULL_38_8]|uniref:Uncharacterized protein n=1 Tax=Candidatus Buchananbacteria bacterium RIFCSPHIGHO2_02_FULL_38_8 TaxID=1797538 RepID=A0A1G1Y5N4_9BACT|nr:MAG: hypothetical protein A3J62_03615 [Candidatus Buchananbacteria bacterium RIFCSPHIGHO2_02_FULL_38_8]